MSETWRAVPDDDRPDMFWNVVDERRHCIATGMTEGDARLLAAAPEMREALDALDKDWSEDFTAGPDTLILSPTTRKIWLNIRSALAKSRPDVAGGSGSSSYDARNRG